MGEQPVPACEEAWLQTVEPVIQAIVRQKLGVFLAQSYGQQEHQDTFELLSAIRSQLWQALTQSAAIQNVKSYAARVSYNTCAAYFRQKFPRRANLKNCLRYILTHRPAYALWETNEGELACGFASWRAAQRSLAEPAQVSHLYDAPPWGDVQVVSTTLLEHMQGNDWQHLCDTIFHGVQAPLSLDDLVAVAGKLLHVHDEPASSLQDETASGLGQLALHEPGPERLAETRDTLHQLWKAIVQLPPRYRIAYLLNPTDGELDIFPWHGVASVLDIGVALALTPAQYAQLWQALPLDDATRQDASNQQTLDRQFATLWKFLPLEDALIASLLGATRQQIINLRRLARDRLARQLRASR